MTTPPSVTPRYSPSLPSEPPAPDARPVMPVTIRTLSADECHAMLAAHHVGRFAYAYKQRVDIEPLHYVADGEWLYLRTAHGTKVSMLEHQPWVAMEIDEVKGLFEWKSVVVHGSVQLITQADGPDGGARWHHAVSVFRRLVPTAFGDGDPTPQRDILVRVHMSHVDGREASVADAPIA
ncbi:MAG TPA: pyridoxamine 5'-phosphate oxidase family protein [Gemmatimonadaceae bacterium]|nr:pyridoxamine 5'-phosphate oxidase family protein [Gemmatimonadaceae bacterium]